VFILKQVTGEFLDVFIAEDLAGILGAKTGHRHHDFMDVFIPKGVMGRLILDVLIPEDLTTDFRGTSWEWRERLPCRVRWWRNGNSQFTFHYLMQVNKGAH
jgi:hypothetical protein